MLTILNIPIEPLEERYSVQWDKWFTEGFTNSEIPFTTIYGEKTSGKINVGSFLDVLETNQYKVSQLSKIIGYLKTYDNKEKLVLFFHDLWFPGLETIAYIRDGLGLDNLKICGCLHAGSYDEWDYLNKVGMTPWAEHMENGWFSQIADQIYVATEFHKTLLHTKRQIPNEKITVTGFPMYPDFLPKKMPEKENIIVFPHRLDAEKKPEMFETMCQRISPDYWEWKWFKSKDVTKNKKEYYELLCKSKIAVSFALQETWGIAMQEAVLCGCVPICPNRLSYTELYESSFLYDSYEEAASLIRRYINYQPTNALWEQQKKILKRGSEAIPKIINSITWL